MTVTEMRSHEARVTSVVIVARDERFRGRMRSLLRALPDVRLAGEATDGISAAAICALGRPDVLLIDARLPWIDASEVLRRVCAMEPAMRILACTSSPSTGVAATPLSVGPAIAGGLREELPQLLRRVGA
jgi:chemotaxis response regulator CheB